MVDGCGPMWRCDCGGDRLDLAWRLAWHGCSRIKIFICPVQQYSLPDIIAIIVIVMVAIIVMAPLSLMPYGVGWGRRRSELHKTIHPYRR